MKYGKELIEQLEREIQTLKEAISNRQERISKGLTDEDDCFLSQRVESRGIKLAQDKINLIKKGGCEWFPEYATLDGKLVHAHWCDTMYGLKLRAVMPDGKVVWTTANTKKGLEKRGLKSVWCLRPAWFKFSSGGQSGLMGAYSGSYELFPSKFNYATGQEAAEEPIEIEDYKYDE